MKIIIHTRYSAGTYQARADGHPNQRCSCTAGGRHAAIAWLAKFASAQLPHDSAALITQDNGHGKQIHTYDPAATGTLATASTDPTDWTRAQKLWTIVQGYARAYVFGQVLLGAELQRLKGALGFLPGRPKKSGQIGRISSHEQQPNTWPDYLTAELGLAERTANRFIQLAESARKRLRKLGHAKALALLDTPWLQLTEPEQESLTGIVRNITDGTTQAELLQELKIARTCPEIGGPTPRPQKPVVTETQLSFDFFAPAWESICTIRNQPDDLTRYLHMLPLQPDEPGGLALTTLEVELEATLKEVRAARKKRLNPGAADNVIDITA